VRSFCPWSLLPCLLSMQYVERLERYHEVPLEDPMRVVNTSLNAICMKDSWHKYVDRSLVARTGVREGASYAMEGHYRSRLRQASLVTGGLGIRSTRHTRACATVLRPLRGLRGDWENGPPQRNLRCERCKRYAQVDRNKVVGRERGMQGWHTFIHRGVKANARCLRDASVQRPVSETRFPLDFDRGILK
jgi:hypothetical protein